MNLLTFRQNNSVDFNSFKSTLIKDQVLTKPARLQVKELEFGVLKPLNFELLPGKILGVVGANGAGKSTLLKLLYRLHKPKQGTIYVNDQALHDLSGREAAKIVAAVVQEQPTELSLTVLEIIKLGLLPHGVSLSNLNKADQEHIDWVLSMLSLEGLQSRQFSELSGGERQRVMIGRALAQRPGLMILDEPTNHLDIRHQLELLQLVQRLNITVVIALHDLNLAHGYTDEVLILNQGHAIAHGDTEQMLNADNIQQAFSIQAKRQQCESYFTFSLQEEKQLFA